MTSTTPENVIDIDEQDKKIASCRFYEKKYPDVDDLVMVKVKSIAEMGAYVSLQEYNDIEGMILLSELSRKRIRSISKLIRVGKQEVCVVLRVDQEKGYIDVSKRRVSPEDQQKCDERFNKSKAVHSLMRNLADKTGEDMEKLYEQITWPLYKKFPHAYDAFKLALVEPEKVFTSDLSVENPAYVKELLSIIQKKMKPQPVKIRADIEVTCFAYDGISAIKAALKGGEQVSDQDNQVKITLVAPPLYVVVTQHQDKAVGIALLEKAIKVIEQKITQAGGAITVKAAPRAISARDDHAMNVLLEQLKAQNSEVDGDGPEEDGDD